MDKDFRKSIFLSLLCHLVFIALLVGGPKGCGGSGDGNTDSKQGSEKDNGQIEPLANQGEEQEKEITVTLIERITKKSEKPKEEGLVECEGNNWFGGIGIVHSKPNYEITEVPAGYPAYNAGIVPGDKIISDVSDIRGQPGTPVTIIIQRSGETIAFNLVRAKICTIARKIP